MFSLWNLWSGRGVLTVKFFKTINFQVNQLVIQIRVVISPKWAGKSRLFPKEGQVGSLRFFAAFFNDTHLHHF